jgi:phospholipid/cholesterol/gamma-HCH transport system ATP-binding protein
VRQDDDPAPDRRPAETAVGPRDRRGPVGSDLDREALYTMRRRFGMLFQFGALFTDMTVFENIAFALREHTDLPRS